MSGTGQHYRPSPHAAFAEVADGGVVLHMGTKRYFSLNETGAAAWRMLEGGSSEEEVVAHFIENFEVGVSEAVAALDSLLAEMCAEELLEAVGRR